LTTSARGVEINIKGGVMERLITKTVKNVWYRMFVFAVIMPINGVLITKGYWLVGLLCIAAQIPTFYPIFRDESK
jgi:hypothetical protein